MIRNLVGTMLHEGGYNVMKASSGNEGIKTFAEHEKTISLILSDVLMPNMSRPEMLDCIVKLQPGIPIMFVTGTVGDAMLPGHYKQGYSVLYKPFTIERLLEAVRKRLASRT